MPPPRRPSVLRNRKLPPKPNERGRTHRLRALLTWPLLRPPLLLNLSSLTSLGSRTLVCRSQIWTMRSILHPGLPQLGSLWTFLLLRSGRQALLLLPLTSPPLR